MRNFNTTFETRKRSFISVFSICITVPLNYYQSCEFFKRMWMFGNLMKVKCAFLYAITLSHYELKFSVNVVDS